MTAAVQLSPVELYRQQVLPPEKATDLYRSLPSHIKPAVFERNLINALMANPDLLRFDPRLVYREVSKAAGLGLLLDPILGEAYIVTAYNYRTKSVEPQLRVGYKGMCKLARQAGGVSKVYAREVHANDFIECVQGSDEQLVHKPDLFGDRGPLVGYYAVIKWDDGSFDFEPMTVKQCQDIRDRSDAWKAFTEKKIKSTPWSTDEVEMSKKTALRRLMKRQQQSPEMTEAIRIEDEAEFPSMRSAPKAVEGDAGPPRASQITHQPQPTMKLVETPEAEVVEAEKPVQQAPRASKVMEDAGPIPEILRRNKPAEAKGDPGEPPGAHDPEGQLAWIRTLLASVEDPDKLPEVWDARVDPIYREMFPPDQEEAMGIYRARERELAP